LAEAGTHEGSKSPPRPPFSKRRFSGIIQLGSYGKYRKRALPGQGGSLGSGKHTFPIAISGIFSPGGLGRVEVFSEYAEGLKDIETFSHRY